MQSFLKVERIAPEKAPAADRLKNFNEIYTIFDTQKAASQAERCVQCGDVYCASNGCPLHNYIPYWLKAVAEENLSLAFKLSNENSPFPEILGRICPQDRLCEGACTLNLDGFGAISIGAIETAITTLGFENKERFAFAAPNGKKAAIIGSGPASLSCATFLMRHGIAVEIFEKDPKPGGLLMFGIPGFKLDKEVVLRRFDILRQAGAKIELGVEIGKDLEFDDLLGRFDAIFVGVGAREATKAGIAGEEGENVLNAVEFLSGAQKQLFGIAKAADVKDKKVVVIGGGDTAMDCVRTSLRLGAKSAVCVYRRDERSMPGSKKEFINAKEEGAEFWFNYAPSKITLTNNKAAGVTFAKTVSDGRGRIAIDSGDTKTFSADLVIMALGFTHQKKAWLTQAGVKLNEKGAIAADKNGATDHKKVFAGGDAVRGAALAVKAAADGKAAAMGIVRALIG
ncbi:MAG: glutamate synthase subunit beta [Helicobacteraceae bacterium]|jgi:glutamate synthase (NADPH/NADH) small chain|nr:glutamate synthase subunit beta [Helicobacteraceae bacterium]